MPVAAVCEKMTDTSTIHFLEAHKCFYAELSDLIVHF